MNRLPAAALCAVLLALTLTTNAEANAAPDDRGEVTYGNRDNRTPYCATRREYRRLHPDAHRPIHYYVDRNLFGRYSLQRTYSEDGVVTRYAHDLCWRGGLAHLNVYWSRSVSAYRVWDKDIRR